MERSDHLLIMGTFLFGCFAGAYVYLVLYVPSFQSGTFADEPDTSFTLVGDAYGPCAQSEAGCPSFRLTADGAYRIVYTDETSRVNRTRDGRLRSAEINALADAINDADRAGALDDYTGSVSCRELGGGVRYELTVGGGERYVLDTCRASVSTDDELWQALQRVSRALELQ